LKREQLEAAGLPAQRLYTKDDRQYTHRQRVVRAHDRA
jgi:hypothetical protein